MRIKPRQDEPTHDMAFILDLAELLGIPTDGLGPAVIKGRVFVKVRDRAYGKRSTLFLRHVRDAFCEGYSEAAATDTASGWGHEAEGAWRGSEALERLIYMHDHEETDHD